MYKVRVIIVLAALVGAFHICPTTADVVNKVPFKHGGNCFMSVGNWGQATAETHSMSQVMQHVATEKSLTQERNKVSVECDLRFVASVGDNILPDGTNDAHDPRFKANFEDVFVADESPLQVPWIMTLGNSDYAISNGDDVVSLASGAAQVAYGFESPYWVLPESFFHYVDHKFDLATGRFISVDAVLLEECLKSTSCLKPEQLSWLRQLLRSTETDDLVDFVVVIAHYSLSTPGAQHHPEYSRVMLTLLRKYSKVVAYLAGDDHVVATSRDTESPSLSLLVNGGALGSSEGSGCPIDSNPTESASWCRDLSSASFMAHSIVRVPSGKVAMITSVITSSGEIVHQYETLIPLTSNDVPVKSSTDDTGATFVRLVLSPVTGSGHDGNSPAIEANSNSGQVETDADSATVVHVRIRITYTPSFASSPILYVLCALVLITVYRLRTEKQDTAEAHECEVEPLDPADKV